MRKLILILTLFLLVINPCFSADKIMRKEIAVQAADGFGIKAELEYPKVKGQKEYSTVVLLHSLGYSSEWWEDLPQNLLDNGYAVLKIDLRGHGKSIYNAKLVRTSWKDLKNSAYAKYPHDVISVIEKVKSENSKIQFFNKWAIVGADIGASTAVLAAEQMNVKPKTIVTLSPVVNAKGLYIPVKLAHLNKVDIFSISGKNELSAQKSQEYLEKFAQAAFVTYTSEANSTGMIMLKNDASLARIITSWLKEYL